MRILHIVDSLQVGGVESFVYYLIKSQLNDTRLELGILFGADNGELKEKFLSLNIPCHFINLKPFDIELNKYRKIREIASSYDILHIHTFKPIREYFIKSLRVKTIFTQHSVFGWGRKKKITDNIKRLLLRRCMNTHYDYLTFNSNYTKKFWEDYGVSKANSVVIHNGVYFNDKSPSPDTLLEKWINGRFVIGTMSRFIKLKRINWLIEAFSEFQNRNSDAVLLLVGDGDERASLENQVETLGIKDKTYFTGLTQHTAYYQSLMDLCVFPSTTETFGLVAIECMYQGKPVFVMKDGGGITEVVEQIEPENIFDDVKDLSKGIIRYYESGAFKDVARSEKRRNYARKYDMDFVSKLFYQTYEKVISSENQK